MPRIAQIAIDVRVTGLRPEMLQPMRRSLLKSRIRLVLEEQIETAFRKKVSPVTGHRWDELAPYTKAKKRFLRQDRGMMIRTGTTRRTTEVKAQDDGHDMRFAVVTPMRGYFASLTAFGRDSTVVVPKRARAMRWVDEEGEVHFSKRIMPRTWHRTGRKYYGLRKNSAAMRRVLQSIVSAAGF